MGRALCFAATTSRKKRQYRQTLLETNQALTRLQQTIS
jgi:hypothetical protein